MQCFISPPRSLGSNTTGYILDLVDVGYIGGGVTVGSEVTTKLCVCVCGVYSDTFSYNYIYSRM